MNKMFLQKMKESLLFEKQALMSKILENQNITIDTDGDECDEIQGNLILETHNQLHTRNNQKLNSIENALQQIVDNTYGYCQDCGELISEKRLQINPYAITCIGCAEEREFEAKQRKRD